MGNFSLLLLIIFIFVALCVIAFSLRFLTSDNPKLPFIFYSDAAADLKAPPLMQPTISTWQHARSAYEVNVSSHYQPEISSVELKYSLAGGGGNTDVPKLYIEGINNRPKEDMRLLIQIGKSEDALFKSVLDVVVSVRSFRNPIPIRNFNVLMPNYPYSIQILYDNRARIGSANNNNIVYNTIVYRGNVFMRVNMFNFETLLVTRNAVLLQVDLEPDYDKLDAEDDPRLFTEEYITKFPNILPNYPPPKMRPLNLLENCKFVMNKLHVTHSGERQHEGVYFNYDPSDAVAGRLRILQNMSYPLQYFAMLLMNDDLGVVVKATEEDDEFPLPKLPSGWVLRYKPDNNDNVYEQIFSLDNILNSKGSNGVRLEQSSLKEFLNGAKEIEEGGAFKTGVQVVYNYAIDSCVGVSVNDDCGFNSRAPPSKEWFQLPPYLGVSADVGLTYVAHPISIDTCSKGLFNGRMVSGMTYLRRNLGEEKISLYRIAGEVISDTYESCVIQATFPGFGDNYATTTQAKIIGPALTLKVSSYDALLKNAPYPYFVPSFGRESLGAVTTFSSTGIPAVQYKDVSRRILFNVTKPNKSYRLSFSPSFTTLHYLSDEFFLKGGARQLYAIWYPETLSKFSALLLTGGSVRFEDVTSSTQFSATPKSSAVSEKWAVYSSPVSKRTNDKQYLNVEFLSGALAQQRSEVYTVVPLKPVHREGSVFYYSTQNTKLKNPTVSATRVASKLRNKNASSGIDEPVTYILVQLRKRDFDGAMSLENTFIVTLERNYERSLHPHNYLGPLNYYDMDVLDTSKIESCNMGSDSSFFILMSFIEYIHYMEPFDRNETQALKRAYDDKMSFPNKSCFLPQAQFLKYPDLNKYPGGNV